MKNKTGYIISILLILIVVIIFICVNGITYSSGEDKLGSGYAFRFTMRTWEIALLIALIVALVYLVIKR